MLRPTDRKTTAIEKIVSYLVPRRQGGTPYYRGITQKTPGLVRRQRELVENMGFPWVGMGEASKQV